MSPAKLAAQSGRNPIHTVRGVCSDAFDVRAGLVERIQLERRSMNTFQNAEFTEAILREQRFDTLFLATSGLHLPRALLYFSYFSIHPTSSAADYIVPPVSILPTAYNFTIADLAAHEYIGMLRLLHL